MTNKIKIKTGTNTLNVAALFLNHKNGLKSDIRDASTPSVFLCQWYIAVEGCTFPEPDLSQLLLVHKAASKKVARNTKPKYENVIKFRANKKTRNNLFRLISCLLQNGNDEDSSKIAQSIAA